MSSDRDSAPATASAPEGSRRPSITQGDSHRADLLVFEVHGKIERPDIDAMAARVDAAFDRLDEIDILIVMSDFDGVALDAVFSPSALATEARALKHVRRYGVVGAPAWVEAMIETANPLVPVHSKTFDLEDLSAARAWVDGRASR